MEATCSRVGGQGCNLACIRMAGLRSLTGHLEAEAMLLLLHIPEWHAPMVGWESGLLLGLNNVLSSMMLSQHTILSSAMLSVVSTSAVRGSTILLASSGTQTPYVRPPTLEVVVVILCASRGLRAEVVLEACINHY